MSTPSTQANLHNHKQIQIHNRNSWFLAPAQIHISMGIYKQLHVQPVLKSSINFTARTASWFHIFEASRTRVGQLYVIFNFFLSNYFYFKTSFKTNYALNCWYACTGKRVFQSPVGFGGCRRRGRES